VGKSKPLDFFSGEVKLQSIWKGRITERLIIAAKIGTYPHRQDFFLNQVSLRKPRFKPRALRQAQGQENIYEKSDPNRVFNRENLAKCMKTYDHI
jgi:hypothetical protein